MPRDLPTLADSQPESQVQSSPAEVVSHEAATTEAVPIESVPTKSGPVESVTAPMGARGQSPEPLPSQMADSEPPRAPDAAPEVSGEPPVSLAAFHEKICECTQCGLAETRNRFVFGAGNPDADILFVGEAPGADEDRMGEPFVGAAGQLLTKIIQAMGLQREDVFICNVLKCRPPGNRDPEPNEVASCEPYLKEQIRLVKPKVICCLGKFASQALLRSQSSLSRMRGQQHEYEGIPLVVTYHPAALLRNAAYKRDAWEDVKWVRRLYDGVQL
ncbi:MAG: uracil-DNA glycosylase [Gemmatimonadetes bacterium]|nr:uracil-DNA glycosylase [Gemmatimonadota bacterium]MBT6145201.1 uracil-DNA glycosylase [Gemmatimonadota bacterium]MBT7860904.1 uracil-DNA glycosylase [Gemmatimonadota bacterium]